MHGTWLSNWDHLISNQYLVSLFHCPHRRSGRVQHCRIHSRQEAGSPKFYLTDNLVFDTLFALITHYQQVALRCNEFEMKLTEPVPQTNAHESKEYVQLSRLQIVIHFNLMCVSDDFMKGEGG